MDNNKTNTDGIRFFYNGLKVGKGKLQKAVYSWQKGGETCTGYPIPTQMTIYHNSHCGRFSSEIHAAFSVKNDTDSQSDYFVSDIIRISPDHPEFSKIAAMYVKQEERRIKRWGNSEAVADLAQVQGVAGSQGI